MRHLARRDPNHLSVLAQGASRRAAPQCATSLIHHEDPDLDASLGEDGVTRSTQGNRQLVGARQLFEMTQTELFKKLRRSAVEQWTTDAFTAPDNVDESTFVQ